MAVTHMSRLRALPIPSGLWHKLGNMVRQRRNPQPLDPSRLQDLALAYVARFSTSRAKLEAYLHRKLRERGWDGTGEPCVEQVAGRLVELGYVDDESYARAKSASLLRRGYGPRRIGQALQGAGIDTDLRERIAPGDGERRQSALAMARKRRFGPFGSMPLERDKREKQIAAMLRAGHRLDSAVHLVDAASMEAAEQWAAEAEED